MCTSEKHGTRARCAAAFVKKQHLSGKFRQMKVTGSHRSEADSYAVLQVKALFESFSGQPLTAEEIEVLTDNEFNRLAAIFSDVLGSSEPPASFEVSCSAFEHLKLIASRKA